MIEIIDRYQYLQVRIKELVKKYSISAENLLMLAISKQQPILSIKSLIEVGQRHFGENYVQEGLCKIEALRSYPLVWHFVGRIQANKIRNIVKDFSWVHSIDKFEQAYMLNQLRSNELPPLNVCIQININNEPKQGGVLTENLDKMVERVSLLPRLKLRGFMTMGIRSQHFETQRKAFAKLKGLLQHYNIQGFKLDTLSMGMSQDWEAAVVEGSTIIRLGTALFGDRKKN